MHNRLFDPDVSCPSVRTLVNAFSIDAPTARRVRAILATGDRGLDQIASGSVLSASPSAAAVAVKRYPLTWKWARACYRFPNRVNLRLHMLDETIGTAGVDGWPIGHRDGVYYLNVGDTYAVTLAHTPDGWFVGDLETLATRWHESE